MFICKRDNIGCVSILPNWVELECFSDRTRCIWKAEALEGGRGWRRGREAIAMKESSKNCLFAYSGITFERGNQITLATLQLKAFVRQMYQQCNLCF